MPLKSAGVASTGPLTGLRVLDFTHALSGPYCTFLLAAYGAEVWKIEQPGAGDMGRGWGPPFIGQDSAFFLGLNRGKQGIALNLKTPEGLELCLRLADRADVIVENFRPGALERIGLGYEALKARNPRIVYCSISGYGQNGPSRDDPAMDLIVQGASGLLSITGTAASEDRNAEMVRCGFGLSDTTAGLFAVNGILMALRTRDQTGEGGFVDISMLDGMVSTMSSNYMTYLGSGRVPQPMGTAFPTIVPYRVYQASDRGFAIAVGSERIWSALCRVMARPDLETHPEFATNPLRVANRAKLEPILDEIFARDTGQNWVASLCAAGVPASLVLNFEDVAGHAQSASRGLFPVVNHPQAGPVRVVGRPVKLAGFDAPEAPAAPGVGEHTSEILRSVLGIPDIKGLKDAGAVA